MGGTGRVVLGGGVLAETHALNSVVNTVTPTDVFSLAIPPRRLQAGDVLRLKAAGDFLNNTGGNVGYTRKLWLGTTTLHNVGSINFGTGANRYFWTLDYDIHIIDATHQVSYGTHLVSNQTNLTAGSISTGNCDIGYATSAEDTTVAKNVHMEITMGSANALADWRVLAASLTLIREAP